MKLKLFSLLALCMSLFTNLHAQPPDTYGHDIPVQRNNNRPLIPQHYYKIFFLST